MPSDSEKFQRKSNAPTVKFRWNCDKKWAVAGITVVNFEEGEIASLPAADARDAAEAGYGVEVTDDEEEIEVKDPSQNKKKR